MSVSIQGKSPRQSNFELLRIVSMMLVLIFHADFFSLRAPDATFISEHPSAACIRMIIQAMCVVCVNVFVLISGYFGIKPNKKSIMNFLFIIVFWKLLILSLFMIFQWPIEGAPAPTISELLLMLIPGEGDWFVAAYILLLFLAPMANAYIEKSTTKQLLVFLILYFSLQFMFNWLISIYNFSKGYSVLSFIGLYILGALLRRNSKRLHTKRLNSRHYFFGYLFLSIGFAIAAFFVLHRLSLPDLLRNKLLEMFTTYNNIISVACSVLLFTAFMCMSFSNRFINAVAASAFSIYIVHMHPLLRRPFIDTCRYLYNNFDTIEYIGLISLFLITVYCSITAVDRLRIYLWRIISSRFLA